MMDGYWLPLLGTVLAAAVLAPRIRRRLQLSRAKHRSLAGHSRMAKRLASLLPGFAYGEERFFSADDAPAEVVARRREGFQRLARDLAERHPLSIARTDLAAGRISDVQFTRAYRVPFPFSRHLREHLKLGGFAEATQGVTLTDLDGQRFYDLTGSYGVNVFGHDFYKECIAEGAEQARQLGPILGTYHACVAGNAERLCQISGGDEVSFHMSGTEAVMQAVRVARYHTRRKYLVRFCGAYHGWWDDVQPGPGNPVSPSHTYTLKDLEPRTLAVLRTRDDIACVLVNPIQALHPNTAAPSDGSLVAGGRSASFDRAAYGAWLRQLREVCTARGIVLILDEVFLGFRLAPGGAQEYFGVKADLVTYGKTVAGGLPIGVVCGRRDLMRRYREDRPADICFARGTFNAHPYVMTTMRAFLEKLDSPAVRSAYLGQEERWQTRADQLNRSLGEADLPVRVAHLSSVWTVCYPTPSRYHWMFQFYLRQAGLALSWVGTGRLIFSLNYTDADFAEVAARFVRAAQAMRRDGWWWHPPEATNARIRRAIFSEAFRQLLPSRR
jgi:glutamate-1-semialdehyde 2,1-aminomutase